MQTEAGTTLTDIPPTRPGRGRIRRPALTAILILVGLCVWLVDRVTKAWALRELTPGIPEPLLGEFLQLHLLFNPGAAFSLGTNATPVFATIQAIVVCAVLVFARRVGSAWWAWGLGFVLGGAAGNLTDRLTRPPGFAHGEVVDFLRLPAWPVFNAADAAICTGAVILAVAAFRGIDFDGSVARREETQEPDEPGEAAPAESATRGAPAADAAAGNDSSPEPDALPGQDGEQRRG